MVNMNQMNEDEDLDKKLDLEKYRAEIIRLISVKISEIRDKASNDKDVELLEEITNKYEQDKDKFIKDTMSEYLEDLYKAFNIQSEEDKKKFLDDIKKPLDIEMNQTKSYIEDYRNNKETKKFFEDINKEVDEIYKEIRKNVEKVKKGKIKKGVKSYASESIKNPGGNPLNNKINQANEALMGNPIALLMFLTRETILKILTATNISKNIEKEEKQKIDKIIAESGLSETLKKYIQFAQNKNSKFKRIAYNNNNPNPLMGL